MTAPEHAPAWRPSGADALLAPALYGLLAWLAIELSRQPGSVATLWFANMAGAWVLARRPWRAWPALLLLMMAANFVANWAMGDALAMAGAFIPANAAGTALTAWLLQRARAREQAMVSPVALLRTLAEAGLVPALIGATLGALTLSRAGVADFTALWPRWLEGDLIGALSMLPLVLALLQLGPRGLLAQLRSLEAASLLTLTVGMALVIPVSLPFPFVYLSLPLVLIALRRGFALTAVANLVVSVMVGTLIGAGLLVAPATTRQWEHVLFYLPILATILPPILLAAAMEGHRLGLRALREREARLRTLYTRTPALLLSFGTDGRLVSVSDHWLRKLGRAEQDVLGQPFWRFLTPESARALQAEVWPALLRTGECRDTPCQWLTHDGRVLEGLLSAIWERDLRGQPLRALAVIEDVTENKRLADFAAEREFIEVTLHSIGDGVIATDADGRVHYINPVAETLLGWTRAEAQGRPVDEVVTLLDQNTQQPLDNPMHRCLRELRSEGLADTTVLLGRDGQQHPIQDSVAPILGPQGQLLGAVMVFQDVRETRALTRRMAHLAQHDALTDLPNRVLLQDRIQQACEHALRQGGTFGVMFLDLDHFKHINDTLGHGAGDDLLRRMARRLRQSLRASDTICRLGGDEFVMLVSDIESAQDLARVAEKVLDDVARPCQVGGRELSISVSLGLAVYPQDGTEVEPLMKHADAAMYRAKRDGRNRYHFYSLALDEASRLRQQHEGDLYAALRDDRLGLLLHPVVDLANGDITAVAAEAAWRPTPGQPWQALAETLAQIEDSGLLVPLGEALIEQASRQLRAWLDAGLPPRHLALPLSPVLLGATDFSRRVRQSLERYRVPAGLLELTWPEPALHALPSHAQQALGELHALGVRLGVHGLGSGSAGLADLARLPLHSAEIAAPLLAAVPDDAAACRLVQALAAGAQALGLGVVAPGVRAPSQLAWLRTLPQGQACGPWFEAMAPTDAAPHWLAQGRLPLPPATG